MSITTKTGDKGQSGLLGGKRLNKTDLRFDAVGALDELTASLGVAKAATQSNTLKGQIEEIQLELIKLAAEAATPAEVFENFKDKFPPESAPDELHKKIAKLEEGVEMKDFVLPGDSAVNAALHVARTVCRRAERELWRLHDAGGLKRNLPCVYLNRLADLLWLWAKTNRN